MQEHQRALVQEPLDPRGGRGGLGRRRQGKAHQPGDFLHRQPLLVEQQADGRALQELVDRALAQGGLVQGGQPAFRKRFVAEQADGIVRRDDAVAHGGGAFVVQRGAGARQSDGGAGDQAFKDAGLGVENAPLITKSFTYFYNWIPEGTSDDELAQYLDLNVAPFTWTATKKYLQDMNEKYNAGIVDPEFYLTTDDTLAKGKFVSGQCATYSFYMSSGTDVFSSLLANDPNAEVAVMGSTASGTVADGFTAHYYEYPSYGMIMGINANATAEERAATYMFLDWMSQPDNLKYLQYGEEGKTYNVVDGINVYNTDYTGDDKLSNNNNKDYWCLVQEVQHYGDEAADLQANKTTLAPAGYDWVVQDAYDLQKKGESGGIIDRKSVV